jgi:hypothetical protein
MVTVDMISRRLSEAEKRYGTSEREMLGIVHALKTWSYMLDGRVTTVHTDHRPLVLMQKIRNPSGRLAKWLVDISALGATLVFNPGRQNAAADCLSRMFEAEKHAVDNPNPLIVPLKDAEGQETPLFVFNNNYFSAIEVEQLTLGRIAQELRKDEFCSALIAALTKQPIKITKPSVQRFVQYYLDKSIFDQEQGLVFVDVSQKPKYKSDYKILIPKSLQREVIKLNHSLPTAGHPGVRRTLKMVSRQYTWRRLAKGTTQYVRACKGCLAQKCKTTRTVGLLKPAPMLEPFSVLAIDHVGPLPRSKKGHRFLLTVCCPFTGYFEAFPTRTANAKTVVNILVNEIFTRYGVPNKIVSDNSQSFVAAITRLLFRSFRVKPALTTLYHPAANPVERVHSTLKRLIRTYIEENHRDWDLNIRSFCLAINASPNMVTGYSPAFLTFGRELHLPQDPVYSEMHEQSAPMYAVNLISKLRRAIDKAKFNRAAFQKATYSKINEHRIDVAYPVGTKVWLKTHYKSDAPGFFAAKLAARYKGPYTVHEMISPLVYRLRDLRDNKVQKGLQHVSNLRLVIEEEETPPPVAPEVT